MVLLVLLAYPHNSLKQKMPVLANTYIPYHAYIRMYNFQSKTIVCINSKQSRWNFKNAFQLPQQKSFGRGSWNMLTAKSNILKLEVVFIVKIGRHIGMFLLTYHFIGEKYNTKSIHIVHTDLSQSLTHNKVSN